jgi:hypothetical protein
MKTKKVKKSGYNSELRNPAKHIIKFDKWESMSGKEFHSFRSMVTDFYYQSSNEKDLIELVWLWMKENKYSKEDIAAAKRVTSVTRIMPNHGVLCKLLKSGCPDYNEKHNQYWESLKGTRGSMKPISWHIKDAVDKAIIDGRDIQVVVSINDEVKTTPTVSIKERMENQLESILCSFESFVDDWLDGKSINDFDPYKEMLSYEPAIKALHAKIIRDTFATQYEEAKELLTKENDDLNEAYSHLSLKKKKEFLSIYEKIDSACDMIIRSNKSVRTPKTAKAVSKEKIVSKIKFKDKDVDFNLVSINPINIVGATELWVYNTKYRKLGRYIADEMLQTLSVKGSTITGFNTSTSVQKTLRKPEEQLKQFTSSSKPALRKFLTDIKSKDQLLTGRINGETILLKVI